jgi:hypothetical protein
MFSRADERNNHHIHRIQQPQHNSDVSDSSTPDVSHPPPRVVERQDSSTSSTHRMAVDSRFCCNICLDSVVEPVVTQCGHLYCWPCLYRWLQPGMYPEERASLGLGFQAIAVDSGRRVCPVCKAACSVPTLVPIYVRSHEPIPLRNSRHESENLATTGARSSSSMDDVAVEYSQVPTESSNDAELDFASNPTSTTGLRQRRRFHSRDDGDAAETIHDDVPSRPAATSPRGSPSVSTSSPSTPPHQQHNQQYRSNSNSVWVTPLSPTGHQASLSHGLLLSWHQAALGHASHSVVPPIHRDDGRGGDAAAGSMNGNSDLEVNPGATEYLSRLLMILASFVLLCLLIL